MSRKALLAIAASAELLIGAYCALAFVAWTLRTLLFSSGEGRFPYVIFVWGPLAAICFWLYSRTVNKVRELESGEAAVAHIDRIATADNLAAAAKPPATGASASQGARG